MAKHDRRVGIGPIPDGAIVAGWMVATPSADRRRGNRAFKI